jgi:hypothetical protein
MRCRSRSRCFFCPEAEETGWSDLGNRTVQFGGHRELVPASVLVSAFAYGTLSCSVATSSRLFSALGFTSPSAPDCSLVDRQRVHPSVILACARNQELLLLSRKLDHPVWGFGSSNFPILESCCPVGGRCICNGRLLCSSLHSQNPQQVLTISGGSALVAEPMVHTTLPNVDKAGTSSTEVPMAQALVARPRNKAPDDNLADDDLGLLNFTTTKSKIVFRMSSRL